MDNISESLNTSLNTTNKYINYLEKIKKRKLLELKQTYDKQFQKINEDYDSIINRIKINKNINKTNMMVEPPKEINYEIECESLLDSNKRSSSTE